MLLNLGKLLGGLGSCGREGREGKSVSVVDGRCVV